MNAGGEEKDERRKNILCLCGFMKLLAYFNQLIDLTFIFSYTPSRCHKYSESIDVESSDVGDKRTF